MHKALILFFCSAILIGCKSPTEKIDQFTENEDFDGALAFLVEKKVAPSISPKLDKNDEDVKKLILAREAYQSKVEARFGKPATTTLDAGNSRMGMRLAISALAKCPWSYNLQKLKDKASARCARLDKGISEFGKINLNEPSKLWAFVSEYKPDVKFALDDSQFRDALKSASIRIAQLEAADLKIELKNGDVAAVNIRMQRLKSLYVEESDIMKLTQFSQEILASYLEPKIPESTNIKEFIIQRSRWSATYIEQLKPVLTALIDAADNWMDKSLQLAVEKNTDEKGLVDTVEELFRIQGSTNHTSLNLAKLHRIRGARLAKEGANASAALFHLQRARELDPSCPVSSLIDLAMSTRSKLKTMDVSLTLSSGSEAAPDTIEPLYYISALNLIDKTRDGVRWILFEPESTGVDVTLFIQKAERFVPKMSDLTVVNSRYFAHMQTVPNPQKSYLKSQLNSAEISYQFAVSSYNSAVNSFNIYPTQYSLSSVNYAENNLELARTHYNSLVSLYNATPSTIQQPVYLPYSFFEGNMRCGYIANGKVIAQGVEVQFSSNRVDTNYVRLNTKYTDVNSINRRDVQYPVDNISEQLFSNIYSVAADLTEKVASIRILPKDEFIGNLSEDEQACVAYAMHPLKTPNAVGIGLPTWAQKFAEACRYAGIKVLPPEQHIDNCHLDYPAPFDDPISIEIMRGMVCRIDCHSPFGDSRGTGSVISANGLILTAAHVIRGSDNKVTFNSGPNKGVFETEIVFVDDKNDVAILRAKTLKSSRWFNLHLVGFPSPGEGIMAIGYPGKPSSGELSQDFITKGIISASNSSKGWLVADLTVASGNSGGPIISIKTGEIIGVVSQVISPSITKNYAGSGYWCKAFPAARLTEALGIKLRP